MYDFVAVMRDMASTTQKMLMLSLVASHILYIQGTAACLESFTICIIRLTDKRRAIFLQFEKNHTYFWSICPNPERAYIFSL